MTNLSIGGLAAYYAINNKITQNRFFKNAAWIYLPGILLIFIDNVVAFPGKDALFKTLEALFFAFVILDQCYNTSGKFKIGNSRLLTGLGKYTYGIYMLHALILYCISIGCIALKIDVTIEGILKLVLGLPLVIAAAYISYEFYEKRFLGLKEKFGYRKNAVVRNETGNMAVVENDLSVKKAW